VDTLRNWVVAGISDPIGSWNDETESQFRLARKGAAQLARTYAEADFTVVIDDVITPEHFQSHYLPHLSGIQCHQIMLMPRLEIALARNAQRSKVVDASQRNVLISAWHRHAGQLDLASLGWQRIDSSDLSVDETVNEIIRRFNDL